MSTSFMTQEELLQIGFKEIGKNVQISRNVSIYGASKMSIGNNVRIDDFCILSGVITIGSNVHIAAFCGLFGGESGIEIDDFAGLSSRISIYADSDDYSGKALTNPTVPDEYRYVTGGRVKLGRHAIIGTGCSILPNVKIGEGSSVGSMSLVNKDLDSWGVYVGIPCKKVNERSKDLLVLEKRYLSEK